MHILIAPDSYKGSLTARQVCDILAQALLTHPGVTVATLPLSDGGEGLAPAALTPVRATPFTQMPLTIWQYNTSTPVHLGRYGADRVRRNLRFTDEKGHYGRLLLRRGYAAEKTP